MLSCIKHACFHVFYPFSAYFSPHDIIVEKGRFFIALCLMTKSFMLKKKIAIMLGY